MTIKKGEDWGSRGVIGADTPIVDSDAGLAELFSVSEAVDGALDLSGPDLVGLVPGDTVAKGPRRAANGLASTLGARGSFDSLRSGERIIVPIDLGIVTLSYSGPLVQHCVMASSLVICSRFWAGVTNLAMNAAFLGDWNVTPAGHPNDGRFDIVRAQMSMSDRLKARSRLASGTHLPHPDISIKRQKLAHLTPAPSARAWIDGEFYGAPVEVALVVIPDAVNVAI